MLTQFNLNPQNVAKKKQQNELYNAHGVLPQNQNEEKSKESLRNLNISTMSDDENPMMGQVPVEEASLELLAYLKSKMASSGKTIVKTNDIAAKLQQIKGLIFLICRLKRYQFVNQTEKD